MWRWRTTSRGWLLPGTFLQQYVRVKQKVIRGGNLHSLVEASLELTTETVHLDMVFVWMGNELCGRRGVFIDPGTPQWQIGPEGLAAEGVWSEIAARVCGAIGRIAALQGRPVVGSIQSSLACRLVECRWVFPLQDLLDSWAASNFGLPFKAAGLLSTEPGRKPSDAGIQPHLVEAPLVRQRHRVVFPTNHLTRWCQLCLTALSPIAHFLRSRRR